MFRLGFQQAAGLYSGGAEATPIANILTAYTAGTTTAGTTEVEIHATPDSPDSSTDFLVIYRGMYTNSAANESGGIRFRTNDGSLFHAESELDPAAHVSTSTGFLSANAMRLRNHSSAQYFSQGIVEITGAGTATADHNGTVAFDLNTWTDDVDYAYDEPAEVTFAGYAANTDENGPSSSLLVNETGNHLLFWMVEINASGQIGLLGIRLDVDGVDPYNTVGTPPLHPGFKFNVEDAQDQFSLGGCCRVNFASTGSKTVKFIANVGAGLVGTDSSLRRARFFLIPESKFNNVFVDSTGAGSSTTSTSYQSTNFSVGPLSGDNTYLIMFSGPCKAVSDTRLISRFVSDGSADLSNGDNFGSGQSSDLPVDSFADSFPLFNFVTATGLDGETVSVEFARLGGGATESVILNCQDDATLDATSFLIAIELAR